MHKQVTFYKNESDIALMAVYVSNLVKENVAYRIDNHMDKFIIEVVGY